MILTAIISWAKSSGPSPRFNRSGRTRASSGPPTAMSRKPERTAGISGGIWMCDDRSIVGKQA